MKALQNAAPGQLFFMQINSPVQRRELPERLKAEGLKASYAVADFAKLPRSGNPCKVLDEFVKDCRQIKILYVEGLDLAIASHPYPGDAIEELSLGRELLASLGVAVVFLLPRFLIDLIRSQALNLWSWRAHDFNLDPIDRDRPLTDFRPFFEGVDSIAPGDTPESRDRRIRILRRLYDQAIAERRTPESLVDPIVMPLAEDLFVSGRYAEAEELLRHALSIYEKTPRPEHPNVAILWNNLGEAWRAKGDHGKAIAYFEKALESDLKTLGPEHPNVAILWNNLGGVWRDKGDHGKAIEFYEKALESDLKTLGPGHPSVAILWNNLGGVWRDKGDHGKAIAYFEKARASAHKTLGPEHPDTLRIRRNLEAAKDGLEKTKKDRVSP
ncbi:MAG: tetratricopeptide repeat protein [Nitrospinae bacterium]|nr:tetratricopeptide repeat protein [Nitrospinota bacterium]